MSAQGSSFLYWLTTRMSQGATPIDGMLWADAAAARRRQPEPASQPLAAALREQISGCEDCPSPIF